MKSYICPACGKKQTEVIEWGIREIADLHDLKSGQTTLDYDKTEIDFDRFACYDCEEPLPKELEDKLLKEI